MLIFLVVALLPGLALLPGALLPELQALLPGALLPGPPVPLPVLLLVMLWTIRQRDVELWTLLSN